MKGSFAFIIPPFKKCDFSNMIITKRVNHPLYCFNVSCDNSIMYVLILVCILKRWILSYNCLEEFKQLSLVIRLSSKCATFLLVTSYYTKWSPVIMVPSEPHLLFLNNLFDKIVFCISNDTKSEQV